MKKIAQKKEQTVIQYISSAEHFLSNESHLT